MTDKHEQVRKQVEDTYAGLVTAKKSCCGGGSPGPGKVAELAGYAAELEAHPEAGASSFGCGNPLAFSGVTAGQTVLDLGSGAGLDLLIAAGKVGETGRVIGVDMTDAMIETARRNMERAGAKNVEIRKGIIEELPVEDGSVDWVISNCVINLSPQKERVFAEMQRVLKPGGEFSVSDMVVDALPDWARDMAAAYTACIGGAVSESEYIAGLRAAGLDDVAVADRMEYTAEQLASFAEGTGDAERFAELAGKVHSVRFTGRKAAPASE
jgi:arsenite methyltransferase